MRRREFLLGSTAATVLAACSAPRPPSTGTLIRTDTGSIQGYVVDGIHRFLGIPYAEPPFGENRFLPPVPRKKWLDTLDAANYGLICPQTGGQAEGQGAEGEDSLNLNVWTPDPAAKGLPVMVWVHGGGQVTGSGTEPLYDGTNFARDGVVLITNNRRLGAEGYLYLPELFGDGIGTGNLGILDQIEVLRWVQRNAERFGGDPNNVTLFGESGGGAAIQALVAHPDAKGLVHRVILQSGGHAAQRSDSATNIARVVLDKMGIQPGDLDTLRRTPWSEFPKHYTALQESAFGTPQAYLPVISEQMPYHPVDACEQGLGADLDYLIGTCRDEMNLFDAFPGDAGTARFRERQNTVFNVAGISQEQVRQAYRTARSELDSDELDLAIMGDIWFRVPSIRIAETHAKQKRSKTYVYLFAWESQFLGAAHAMDILVFGNGVPFGMLAGFRDEEEFAQKMRTSWVNFAKFGDPSQTHFNWPTFSSEDRWTAILDDNFSLKEDLYKPQRKAMTTLFTKSWTELGI